MLSQPDSRLINSKRTPKKGQAVKEAKRVKEEETNERGFVEGNLLQ
jgi:hypothetical protein